MDSQQFCVVMLWNPLHSVRFFSFGFRIWTSQSAHACVRVHIPKEKPKFNVAIFQSNSNFFSALLERIKPRCAAVLTHSRARLNFLMIDYCKTNIGCKIHLASVKMGEGSRHTSFGGTTENHLRERERLILESARRVSVLREVLLEQNGALCHAHVLVISGMGCARFSVFLKSVFSDSGAWNLDFARLKF